MNHNGNRLVLFILLLALVFASFSSLAQSVTWSVNVKRMTNYTYVDNYPAIMQTKDKKIWLVWSREIMGNLTLYYRTSSNLGFSWSEEKNLTTLLAPCQSQNPSIMQATDGTIWLAWASDAPPPPAPNFYMTADPQKLTIPQGSADTSNITITSIYNFNETVKLSAVEVPEGVTTVFNPTQVTPLPNGEINSTLTISIGLAATPGNYTFTVVGKGTTQTHSIGIDLEIIAAGGTQQSNEREPTSAQSTGLDYIFYDYEIHFKTSRDNGATWSIGAQITDNNVDDMHPCIIQLQNGTIMLVWQTYISGNAEICYKTSNGTSWSNTTQLTADPASDKAPNMIQTKNGQIWVVWSSDRFGDYEVFTKVYNGTWSSDTRLTTSIDYDLQPAILQAANTDIIIFWASDASGDFNIYYKYSTDNGTTWSTRTTFASSGYEDTWPALMRAHDTKIWVAYSSNEPDQPDGNWEIFIKTSLAGDINADGLTNIVDLTIVSLAFGSITGEPGYNVAADLNRDGLVDMRDMRIVAYYLLET